VAILVPAHNEASGIAAALQSMLPQLGAQDRLLVVADNCTDDTARVAKLAGAEVVERSNAAERGKGFALAHGVAHLHLQPPDMVVILDADCTLAPGSLQALTRCVTRYARPAQALYLMQAPMDSGLGARLAEFAWRVRNWVRPAGWQAWGMPCQLMGAGMAFSWAMLRTASLANASIVEDMKLGIELACQGQPPVFCAEALVTSAFPLTPQATQGQRTRWEHGHMEMILREVPAMVWQAVVRRDLRLLGLAMDLAVPPLALLAGLLAASWCFSLVVWMWLGAAGPLLGFSAAGLVLALVILRAWYLSGRDIVRLSELLCVPWYVAVKLPIYLRFLVRRQKEWVRTGRGHGEN
jgi:cellulose synthase/poly-beta-1,6-N-acetylglucosamine synthase-like glycosyltransferase